MSARSFLALAVLAAAAAPASAGGQAGRFDAVAGAWQGDVTEMGLARYEVRLTLASDGTGQAEYPGFPCTTRLAPARGEALVLTETVIDGREHCSDGTVELTRSGRDELRWLWRDGTGAVRAVARLAPAQ